MRWLLDQGLPRGAARLLVEAGHDAVHVGDLGMAAAADEAILDYGNLEGRVVVTLDADFHMLLANSGASRPSVIRIREEGMKAPEISAVICAIRRQWADALDEGCVMVYARRSVRFRRLPLRA